MALVARVDKAHNCLLTGRVYQADRVDLVDRGAPEDFSFDD